MISVFNAISATQLASIAIDSAIKQAKVPREAVDEVILGNVISAGLGEVVQHLRIVSDDAHYRREKDKILKFPLFLTNFLAQLFSRSSSSSPSFNLRQSSNLSLLHDNQQSLFVRSQVNFTCRTNTHAWPGSGSDHRWWDGVDESGSLLPEKRCNALWRSQASRWNYQ
jgi:hypothetical protein